MSNSERMTSSQVAALTGLHISTVNRDAGKGLLRTAQKVRGLRGVRLFDPADVEAYRAVRAKESAA